MLTAGGSKPPGKPPFVGMDSHLTSMNYSNLTILDSRTIFNHGEFEYVKIPMKMTGMKIELTGMA